MNRKSLSKMRTTKKLLVSMISLWIGIFTANASVEVDGIYFNLKGTDAVVTSGTPSIVERW